MDSVVRVGLVCIVALSVASCGAPSPHAGLDASAPPAETPRRIEPLRPATPAAPPVPLSPPPPPPPDPAAIARARAEAERAALEAAYPEHGVVYHFLAQVFAEPSNRARVVGYARRGAQFRAKGPVPGRGCSGGWFEVPGDGFVCRGNGFQIGPTPQTFEPSPLPPALDDALPYAYAKTVRDDIAQFWRLPNLAEEDEAQAILARLRAAEERAAAADAGTRANPDGGTAPAEGETRADGVDAPPPPGQAAVAALGALGEGTEGVFPEFLRGRMLSGFYVSLDRIEETTTGRRFYRTVRGGYVRADAVIDAQPPSMRGVVLGGDWQLPVAFVFRGGARRLHLEPSSDALVDIGTYAKHTPMVVADTRFVRRDRVYVMSRDGELVREPSARLVEHRERPAGIPAGAHWIHVKLGTQTLVAYEDDVPVFATLVSSGKEGHETPTGVFQIQSKHVSTTMDDALSPDGAYSIEDVPWTMYFQGNFALHGAFWHSSFGQVRSHGCVNLAPADARWLFSWTTPTLPAAWHGVFADRRHPGTWVFIEP